MAVFIVPSANCNQHAFYGMSHGDFRINLTTLPTKNDIQACAFQPSFITDINQNITFGVNSESDQEGYIFYGFDDKSSQLNDIMTKKSQNIDQFNNKINNIIQELDYYQEFKKLYRKKFKQMDFAKDRKKYNIIKHKFTYENDKFISSKISKSNFVVKDEDEELFFQQNYQKYKNLLKINSAHNFKNLNRLMKQDASKYHHPNSFSSPGFLYSNSTTSIQSFATVNTEFYVIYKIKNAEKSSEVILERKFLDNQDQTSIDNSMLHDHYDFLLYYDKGSSSFIYDTKWVNTEIEDIPKSYFWKVMKWFLALIIIIVSIIIVFIVVSVVNYTKRNRLCCFKKLNNNQEMNEDDYNLNMAYPNSNRRRSNNSNELELETVCYPPDLDDLVTYNKSTKKKRSSMIENYDNIHDSDSYEYITESSSCEDGDLAENNNDTNGNSTHKKKRIKKMKINYSSARISASPYDIDAQNTTDIGDLSAENLTNETSQETIGENGENIPNPYGLPSLVHNSNETNNDENSDVNPTC